MAVEWVMSKPKIFGFVMVILLAVIAVVTPAALPPTINTSVFLFI